MDKVNNSAEYCYTGVVVTVQRHFNNDIHINDILKKYILEQKKNIAFSKPDEECYNSNSNITVVSSSERRNM